jgi:hypothetical protein
MKTIQQLAKDAIQVQDASNLVAVVNGMGRMLVDLKTIIEQSGMVADTPTMSEHPITKMWASKIHDLARMGFSESQAYGNAYDWCRKMSDT